MRTSFAVIAFSLAALAGCTPGEGSGPVTAASVFDYLAALQDSYRTSFTTAEVNNANDLVNNDPKYKVQEIDWSFGSGPLYHSYSMKHANVQFAHAVGLTGAGETISIIDQGFFPSHAEFNGKTVTLVSGIGSGDLYHGTGVASLAAGSANSGTMIGFAPGANLSLGLYDSFATMTAATNDAISKTAIVQNNSWGWVGDSGVSVANYNLFLRDPGGSTYVNALRTFASNGVVVFAASNDETKAHAETMAALPMILPELEASWIATINAIPTMSGSTITSATRMSSKCLEAAAWCVAADGTAYVAVDAPVSGYDCFADGGEDYCLLSGTSFAAPQVSGAIALLAEAFPDLTAQELRARVLASANNTFFTHTGFVEFAPGINHGFNTEFGHGFLDVKAALMPIGGAYIATSGGAPIPLNKPVLVSGAMVGDAINVGLAKHSLAVFDGLGSGFGVQANVLSASSRSLTSPGLSVTELAKTDYTNPKADSFAQGSVFGSFASGQELVMAMAGSKVAVLVPTDGGEETSYGIYAERQIELGQADLGLGLSATHEAGSFVGVRALSDGAGLSGDHLAASLHLSVPLASGHDLMINGGFGVARPAGDVPVFNFSTVQYRSVGIGYAMNNSLSRGDRLVLGLAMPQTVSRGAVSAVLPTSYSRSRGMSFETADISLVPQAQQVDLSVGYGVALNPQTDFLVSLDHSLNAGNVAGHTATGAALAWRLNF